MTGSETIRYLARLSYDGGPFRGFAPNQGVATVGGLIAESLERFLQHEVSLTCAGRTDAGVHALDQAIHFDTTVADLDVDRLRGSLNGMCKPHVAVREITAVPADFDARFSCIGRTYRYRLLNTRVPDPFRHAYTWRVVGSLDLAAMEAAGRELIGRHDFSSFCRRQIGVTGEELPRVRDLRSLEWARESNDEVHLVISASSFCQQMVRSIAGLCVDVGLGRVRVESVAEILASLDRTAVPRIAPPQGLYLIQVDYPQP